jgi:hypothetical protein
VSVIPANAGIYKLLKFLDPGVRRDDVKRLSWAFYEFIRVQGLGFSEKYGQRLDESAGR